MPLINLVQDRQIALRKNERRVRGMFFSSVAIFVSSVLLYGSLTLKAEVLRRDKAQLSLKLSQIKPLVAQTEANEKATRSLLPRLQTLEDAQTTSDKWSHILTHLTKNTPEGVWLTALRGSNTDPKLPISVTLIGKGGDQKIIAELILRAQALSDLSDVNLKYSELRQDADSHSIEFEIEASVAGTAPDPVKRAGSGT